MGTKKTSLKKLAIVFSAAILGTYGLVLACGGDIDFGWRSSFTPEVYVKESYKPLFYDPNTTFYSDDDGGDKNARFNEQIMDDWSTYLKGKVTREQVSLLLVSDSSTSIVNDAYDAIKRKQTPKNIQRLDIKDPKVVSFIEFLWNAKVIERYSTRQPDSWDYETSPKETAEQLQTISRMEKLYNETKDPFLKNRYWFQIMKAHFYSEHKENMIAFFEKTKSTVPENTLYYRALGYLAGVYHRKKDYHMANYLYSVVFEKCEPLRPDAGLGFHPEEDADMQVTLRLAKSADEKCALWTLRGYYVEEERAINEIYKLNPASPHIDLLLTRAVNQFEYFNENFAAHKSKTFIESIAREGKVQNRYLWNSAAGYLNIFANDSTTAGKFLREAVKYCPDDKRAQEQLKILRTINLVAGVKKIDRATENRLLPQLLELNRDSDLRKDLAQRWARHHLSNVYNTVHKNKVFGELFQHNTKFFESNENCDALKAFLEKSDKSEWEKFVANHSSFSVGEINEYQAVERALSGDLDNAISLMEKVNNGVTAELLGNPFNGKIKDCHDCDHAAPQKVKYTKLSYLKKMKEMEQLVNSNTDVYNNALLLANAYYNMIYYGNARVFYHSPIKDEFFGPKSEPTDCSNARKYYQIAFSAAANDEQRAKCTYMLAKCERNDYYTAAYGTRDIYQTNGVDFKEWEGFARLKNEYAHTKYYKEVISECGYFRSYVESR